MARLVHLPANYDLALRAQVRNLWDETTYLPDWGATQTSSMIHLLGRSYHLGLDRII